jgi:hypothetical protein
MLAKLQTFFFAARGAHGHDQVYAGASCPG